MKEIAMIIPYFGKLPEWIQLFINSCENSKKRIDFYIFTDDSSVVNLLIPENVFVNQVSFKWMQDLVKRKGLGNVMYAYKLCDYKPMYGYIFSEYVNDYRFWGYCDVDTILGDIISFLDSYNYKVYDRIGSRGHFTLYKNTDFCNNLFRYKNDKYPLFFYYKFVLKTTYPCHFDECTMNLFCQDAGLKFLNIDFALQTTIMSELHLHTFNCKVPEFFVYEKGKILRFIKQNGEIQEKEYMYIHFQDRKTLPVEKECNDSFLITHVGFIPFNRKNIESYFERYGCYDTIEEKKEYLQEANKRLNNGRKGRLKREFTNFGLRSIFNIYQRSIGISYLKKNGLF